MAQIDRCSIINAFPRTGTFPFVVQYNTLINFGGKYQLKILRNGY